MELKSPVAGVLKKILVEEGSDVKKGNTVAIIESMQMELEIKSTENGIIYFVSSEGDEISSSEIIANIEEETEDEDSELEKSEESTDENQENENLPSNSQNDLMQLQEIHSQKFEVAKQNIEKFSKKSKVSYQVKTVENKGGLFGWFDHKVTGEELNENLAEINKAFTGVNKAISKTIDEFKEIYTALDALDKEYIQRILVNLEMTKRASEDALSAGNAAKSASDDALKANEKSIKNQEDLKNQHEALKLVVEKLKEKAKDINDLKDSDAKKSKAPLIISIIALLLSLGSAVFSFFASGTFSLAQ